MTVVLREEAALRFVEGIPGEQLPAGEQGATHLIESCFVHDVRAVVLRSENLTDAFFDLSSREAGAVLQKLRNYGIRLAVISSVAGRSFSTRFGEMVEEERRGRYFALVDTRDDALAWLRDR